MSIFLLTVPKIQFTTAFSFSKPAVQMCFPLKVTLNPLVTIKDASNKELAKTLHAKANSLCFIANSCNFPVEHHAEVYIKN